MDDWETTRLTDVELKALFDRLFTRGFAGADALAELAAGEKSAMLVNISSPANEP